MNFITIPTQLIMPWQTEIEMMPGTPWYGKAFVVTKAKFNLKTKLAEKIAHTELVVVGVGLAGCNIWQEYGLETAFIGIH
tara:strand:+ start:1989 stop:2228 length:240 start_codon:yes stop_codon:yes gene_type:complete